MSLKMRILEPLRIGQIRKLKSNKKGGASRLVLIAQRDRRDGTFLVFLLNNMLEAAIPRDVCLSKEVTSAQYGIVLMTEYYSRANPEDFDLDSLIGSIEASQVEKIASNAFDNPFGKLPDEILSEGFVIGSFPIQKYDAIWNFRAAEFDNFSKLTYVRDSNSTDYAVRFLRENPVMTDPLLVEDCPIDALYALSRSGEMMAV
jgi:hypothetical protein